MRLSILDQSFARDYDSASIALQETVQMAKQAESLGYRRFWVSEHHAFHALAGSAPEVMLSALGAATKSIRLGSGGIMLPHYSPYKVAEQFSLLANLYPDRIDLGVGRAPGTDMSTATALARSGLPNFGDFEIQVKELENFLRNPAARPLVSPKPPKKLPIWMLGSSEDSAILAAKRGLPYNLGAFINPAVSLDTIELYKSRFEPSAAHDEPYAILTIGVFCAETEQLARAQQRTFDVNFFRFITGRSGNKFLPPKEALGLASNPQLELFMQQRERLRAVGTPYQVKSKLEAIAAEFGADEIMAVSNIYYFEDRCRSYELLANEVGHA